HELDEEDEVDPDLSVTKTATPEYGNTLATAVEVERGDAIVYTIEVENSGTGPALNVVVEDQIPTHLTINQAGIQGQFGTTGPLLPIAELEAEGVVVTVSGQLVRWEIEELAADATFTLIIPTIVNSTAPNGTIFRNQAIITEVDGEDTDYRSEVIYHEVYVAEVLLDTRAPWLNIEKVAYSTVANMGEYIMYTVTLRNTGDLAAYNFWMIDDMGLTGTDLKGAYIYNLRNITAVAVNGEIGETAIINGGTVISVEIIELGVGGVVTITFVATVYEDAAGQTFTNIATLRDENGDALYNTEWRYRYEDEERVYYWGQERDENGDYVYLDDNATVRVPYEEGEEGPQPTPTPPPPPGAGNQGQGIPSTGIESSVVLWSVLLVFALIAATGTAVWITKNKKKLETKK
ncbi:MAG: DUF11 domain-containing protein, partial [Oscillospiraceae bacterium]|nr:DUF11 domain-containing protein [Oscillospiraceae bacterium]